MATKTFKIGEYSRGGVITVETTKTSVKIISKEWDFSAGSRRSSDQSNAKEWNRIEVGIQDAEAYRKLSDYLHDDTTSYYADQILKWIESKVKLSKTLFW
jgi:hypothetical protein